MGKGLIDSLYKLSRMAGKAAGILNDVKTLASGDPVKISKRIARKAINKTAQKINRKI